MANSIVCRALSLLRARLARQKMPQKQPENADEMGALRKDRNEEFADICNNQPIPVGRPPKSEVIDFHTAHPDAVHWPYV